jgi:hypothetical protein
MAERFSTPDPDGAPTRLRHPASAQISLLTDD